MERTMKCSVQVVTAGALVDQDQSLVWVQQEDGHRVPQEVSFFHITYTPLVLDCFFFFTVSFSHLHYNVIHLDARKF